MSVIVFDLSVETTLNILVSTIDSSRTPADGFSALLNQTDDVLQKNSLSSLPDRGNIIRVHNIRNDAQHDARYPSDGDLSDCQTYVKDFLKKIFSDAWKVDFETLSMIDLIQNSTVKTYLSDAEKALQSGDLTISVQKSVTGLSKALSFVGNAIVGRMPVFAKLVSMDSFGKIKEDREFTSSIEQIRLTLLFETLGLNYLDYMKFKSITGEPHFTLGNEEPHDFTGTKENLTENEATFVTSYAINSVISIEDKVGDIENPFGKHHFRWF